MAAGSAGFRSAPSGSGGVVDYWTVPQIVQACGLLNSVSPNVAANWPLIRDALVAAGQGSRASQAAAIATTAIETASSFLPRRELYNDPPGRDLYFEGMYGGRGDLGNTSPGDGVRFYGRGYIQITGRANYRTYGRLVGADLEGNPDLALDPAIAAAVFAAYWRSRDIQEQAERHDWAAVRRSVQGGSAGLERLIAICGALLG